MEEPGSRPSEVWWSRRALPRAAECTATHKCMNMLVLSQRRHALEQRDGAFSVSLLVRHAARLERVRVRGPGVRAGQWEGKGKAVARAVAPRRPGLCAVCTVRNRKCCLFAGMCLRHAATRRATPPRSLLSTSLSAGNIISRRSTLHPAKLARTERGSP